MLAVLATTLVMSLMNSFWNCIKIGYFSQIENKRLIAYKTQSYARQSVDLWAFIYKIIIYNPSFLFERLRFTREIAGDS